MRLTFSILLVGFATFASAEENSAQGSVEGTYLVCTDVYSKSIWGNKRGIYFSSETFMQSAADTEPTRKVIRYDQDKKHPGLVKQRGSWTGYHVLENEVRFGIKDTPSKTLSRFNLHLRSMYSFETCKVATDKAHMMQLLGAKNRAI